MADKAWKQWERACGATVNGKRFPANLGERVDFEGKIAGRLVRGQSKLVRTMSLNALTAFAEEMEQEGDRLSCLGIVMVKVRRGSGVPSAGLVVMTVGMFEALKRIIEPERDTREWAGS